MATIRVYPANDYAYDVSVRHDAGFIAVNDVCECKWSDIRTILSFNWQWDEDPDVEFNVTLSIYMDDEGTYKGLPRNQHIPRYVGKIAAVLTVEPDTKIDKEDFGFVSYDRLLPPDAMDAFVRSGVPPVIRERDYIELINSILHNRSKRLRMH